MKKESEDRRQKTEVRRQETGTRSCKIDGKLSIAK
jgi:hypothetical protein